MRNWLINGNWLFLLAFILGIVATASSILIATWINKVLVDVASITLAIAACAVGFMANSQRFSYSDMLIAGALVGLHVPLFLIVYSSLINPSATDVAEWIIILSELAAVISIVSTFLTYQIAKWLKR